MVKIYTNAHLNQIAFPLGGIGAGMFCVQGNGMLGQFSLRHKPDVNCEPNVFAAVCVKTEAGNVARVLEGQLPYSKIFGGVRKAGEGVQGKIYGLTRFKSNDFSAEFPFAKLNLTDGAVPVSVSVNAFSPFIPLDADNSSLPAASLEYVFSNPTGNAVDLVFYYNCVNFMKQAPDGFHVYRKENGFVLNQDAVEGDAATRGDFYVAVDGEDAKINTQWFDGGWFDVQTMQWNDIKAGAVKTGHDEENHSPGGSIAVELSLEPNESKSVTVKFAWYVPDSDLRIACLDETSGCYKPWYAARFGSVEDVMGHFCENYAMLVEKSRQFSRSLYDSALPEEVIDAVSANLCILKSPTVLRQSDGRLWAWEGCSDSEGSCYGSCTHVWNYAQAICHLFPALERTLRQTEFFDSQDARGHQQFRSSLPIGPTKHNYHAAADGQLGGIMKMHREWKIMGDTAWLRGYWDKILSSIDYCIETWDKKAEGVLREPHHNTYDIEFWGADGMCTSFYLGALRAVCLMGEALGAETGRYRALYEKGREYLETKLFNGAYFYQQVEWETLEAELAPGNTTPQTGEPKYQYGTGCLSDGILGAWMAKMCGLGEILDAQKVKSHLLSVYKYNFRKSLLEHDNPQRAGYALGDEGGLLLCSWPRGGKPPLPFVYSDEVWTGIEYQVASHLISYGFISEGLDIVRTCRARYDGAKRNPFDEYECGHWYARAMSSYGLIQAFTDGMA
ncbi:hypothetical protein FACS189492_1110 [Clostridia bacterium]|nr:hypothetical protein FACS189492_1110 [Clostridia bacterium]